MGLSRLTHLERAINNRLDQSGVYPISNVPEAFATRRDRIAMVVHATPGQRQGPVHPLLQKRCQREHNTGFPVILLPIRAQNIDVMTLAAWLQNGTCQGPLLILLCDYIQNSVVVCQNLFELLLPIIHNHGRSKVFHNARLLSARCGGDAGVQDLRGVLDPKCAHTAGTGLNEDLTLLLNGVAAPDLDHRLKRLHHGQTH
mmetsp:Transcript_15026/g.33050  ORF Transcript_15026/g.33050 Transcript_15026/m.33050 type:complete len:200 (-) Transcript_15026:552-1151(-)